MRVRESLKKVGAVAGSALMVGMTMGAAQSLGSFPQPFVAEDGTVSSQIVVGSQGKVADVVGAVNVAAALGQQAQRTEERQVSTGAGFGWSATDGATLDTRNDNLYFDDTIDAVRQTLTADNLDALAATTFVDENSRETTVEYFLYPGSQSVTFGSGGEQQDPFLLVDNPASVSSTNHLFQMQANFGQEINFTQSVNQDVDLELFGNTYTVSTDSTFTELTLFGSSQSVSLDAGQSGTVTVNENEHTIELVAVNSGGAAYKVDGGTTQQDTEGSTFTIDGETVRIRNVVNLNDDAGSAEFAVGSDEITFTHGDQIQDSEGDDIDGTYVEFDADSQSNGRADDLSTIDIYLGEQDDDHAYVAAGSTFSHPLFRNVRFAFGGLNPDAGAGTSDAVEDVAVRGSGDDTAQVAFTTDRGDAATIGFSHTPDNGATLFLADGSNHSLHMVEAQTLAENEYTVLNAGNEDRTDDKGVMSRMVRVTDISDDEATLRDINADSTFTIDLDSTDGESVVTDAVGSEVIDGRTYHFRGTRLNTTTPELAVAWGDGAGTTENSGGNNDDTITAGTQTAAYMTLTTREGGEITFLDDTVPAGTGISDGDSVIQFNADEEFIDAGSAQSTEGTNGFGDGDDIVRDLGGSGTYSPSADTVVNDEGAANRDDGDALVSVGSTARYYDADSSSTYNGGDEVYQDDDSDTAYTAQADTVFNGTAPSAGTSLVLSPISAWVQAGFIDAADGGAWDAGADTIFYDANDDSTFNATDGDVVMAGTTPADGTAQTGEGGKDADWSTVNLHDNTASDAYDHTVDAVIRDFHNGTTYSAAADTTVSRGSDTTIDVTDGTTLLDLDETTYEAVDDGNDGFDAGTDDDIVTDDDSDNVYTAQADTLIVDGDDVAESAGDTLTGFASDTRHDESVGSDGFYNATETIIIDANTNGQYDSGETILLGSSGGQDMHPAVTDYLEANGKPADPTMFFIEEETDADTPHWYAVGTTGNTGSDRVDVSSPTFRDPSKRATATFESNSDITAGYDVFGAYTEYDTDDQGSFALFYPDGQAAAGAAFTGAGGTLSAAASAQATVDAVVQGSLPNMARLDTEVTDTIRSSNHLILVGGPAVNTLVAQLQDRLALDQVPRSGGALLQTVEDAFTDGRHALVVAGLEADDTRGAARYLQDYDAHGDALAAAGSTLVLTPDEYPD